MRYSQIKVLSAIGVVLTVYFVATGKFAAAIFPACLAVAAFGLYRWATRSYEKHGADDWRFSWVALYRRITRRS